MKTIQIPTSKSSFIQNYVQLLNGLMQLTDMELKVLVRLIHHGSILTTSIRNTIKEDLELKSIANLNNYIKALKDKSVIVDSNKQLIVNPTIVPDTNGLTFQLIWESSSEE